MSARGVSASKRPQILRVKVALTDELRAAIATYSGISSVSAADALRVLSGLLRADVDQIIDEHRAKERGE